MKKIIYGFAILLLSACGLTEVTEDDKNLKLNDKAKANEGYYPNSDISSTVEIYSLASLELELEAIGKGYVPPEGVEERLALIDLYIEYAKEGLFVVNPIRPVPMPVCPPKPRRDCVGIAGGLEYLTLKVFCERPAVVSSEIYTSKGLLAVAADVEFDNKYKQASITYEVVNPELTRLPSVIEVTTYALGEELGVQAQVAGDIF